MTRLAILGVGRIGGETAFLSTVLGLADELVLYDTAKSLLDAQIHDLTHTGIDIGIETDWNQVKDADICVFSAGIPRTPNIRTRADLLSANLPAAKICTQALRNFSGILITVTNPMDINNYYLCKSSGLDPRKCIGFGGNLDSARFGLALRNRGIEGRPWVIGEHGEHQVPIFSRLPVQVQESLREEILAGLCTASMEVIKGKGGTVFGPAWHLAELIRMIVHDKRECINCSCILDGEYGFSRCSLGVPATIGRDGILSIEEWNLDPWEAEKMNNAGTFVMGLCSYLGIEIPS
ncbi:MAG: lactate dehydrogenase [Methanoregulaceae archaeon]|jgi:malate dehydrogenase|nr:lactate dehydrogenase [Methanoregulaceae archaeon]